MILKKNQHAPMDTLISFMIKRSDLIQLVLVSHLLIHR